VVKKLKKGKKPPAGDDPNEVRGAKPSKGEKAKKPKATASAGIDARALAEMLPGLIELSKAHGKDAKRTPENNPFRFAIHPAAAMPPKKLQMAFDNALVTNNNFAASQWLDGFGGEGLLFLGYPYLSELAQRPEYRVISETIADDATRKWIDFEVTGDEDENKKRKAADPVGEAERGADPDERKKQIRKAGKTDKVKQLKDDQARLEVRDHFYAVARNDGFFGRSHLYMNFGEDVAGDPSELITPIGDGRDKTSQGKVARDSFKELKVIEPLWTYPMAYNAINPLRPGWYAPQIWYVMGMQIHGSRIPTFVGHPVPDLLKPAYSFGGLSLSQMAQPYVDIWLQTRESIARLIHSFSVMVLCTDLSTAVQPGNAAGLLARAIAFNTMRDNQGLMVVNKNTEDFKNVQASLAGLHELQAQAQEHMASVSRIPLVKLTGISPSGLNASSEGEIRAYYDTIGAYQNRVFRPNLTRVVNFEQLSLWGEIDPEIGIRFEPLWELSEKEKGEKQKADAERHQIYVDLGAISPEEVRKVIIDEPELPYIELDPDEVPDLLQEELGGLEIEGGRPELQAEEEQESAGKTPAKKAA
jgi:hypothetical protein